MSEAAPALQQPFWPQQPCWLEQAGWQQVWQQVWQHLEWPQRLRRQCDF
ncbi:MAG TPA: hypothetical protein VF278_18215 [Pirellulales bacterium]